MLFLTLSQGGILLSPVLASVGSYPHPVLLQPSPHPSPPALFYLALLLPGVPFALIMWKMRYGADDFDDFLEHCMPTWFLFLSFLIFFGPALAICKPFALCESFLAYHRPPPFFSCSSWCRGVGLFLGVISVPVVQFQKKHLQQSPTKIFPGFRIATSCSCGDCAVPVQHPRIFHYAR